MAGIFLLQDLVVIPVARLETWLLIILRCFKLCLHPISSQARESRFVRCDAHVGIS